MLTPRQRFARTATTSAILAALLGALGIDSVHHGSYGWAVMQFTLCVWNVGNMVISSKMADHLQRLEEHAKLNENEPPKP